MFFEMHLLFDHLFNLISAGCGDQNIHHGPFSNTEHKRRPE